MVASAQVDRFSLSPALPMGKLTEACDELADQGWKFVQAIVLGPCELIETDFATGKKRVDLALHVLAVKPFAISEEVVYPELHPEQW